MKNASTILSSILLDHKGYISSERAEKALKSEYNSNAAKFLLESETKIKISQHGKSTPAWGTEAVNTYMVTLSNARHTYTFEFFDSIKSTREGELRSLDFYSVLACLEKYDPGSFDDFCTNYGLEFKNEREFVERKTTYFSVLDQYNNVCKLFTEAQLETLRDIS